MVFPKVAMCRFARTGLNGKASIIDGLCVLPLNILNEKIFYILWFWYLVLMAISAAAFFYRIFVLLVKCFRRSGEE